MSGRSLFFRSLVAIVVGFGPVIVLAVTLNPQGPMVVPFLSVALLHAFSLIELRGWGNRLIGRFGIWIIVGLGIALLAVNIVIIPHSAYISWFRLLSEGRARGSVSFVFVMTTAFFSGLFSSRIYSKGFLLPLLGLSLSLTILASIMFQSRQLFLVTLALIAASLVVLRVKQVGVNVTQSVLAIVVFLAVSLGIASLFSRNFEPAGSKMVDRHLSPYFRGLVVDAFPNFPIVYSIPGYGYSFESETPNFGNTPILSSNALFQVTADPGTTVYLRTKVHEVFEENRWKILEDSLEVATVRRDLNAARYLEAPLETDIGTQRIEVELLGDFYAMLPHTLEMKAIRLRGDTEPRFQYASMDTGFLLESPMIYGDRVVIATKRLSQTGEENEEPPELESRGRYLQTPPGMPSAIVALANDLRRDSLPDTVLALRDFLREEYEYSLETETPPNDRDFTEWFLFESQTGYCVHFATAFVMLARTLGLPARYATGFLVNVPDITEEELFELGLDLGPQTVSVTGLSAHAWPEIWVPGLGWTIFEATPPMIPEIYNDPLFAQLYGSRDNLTGRQLSAILGNRLPEEELDKQQRTLPIGALLWIVAAVVAVGAGAFLVVRVLRQRGHLETGSRKRLQWILRRLVRKTNRLGVPAPTYRGWVPWMDGILNSPSINGSPSRNDLSRLVEIVHRSFFGGYVPDQQDLEHTKRMLAKVPRKPKRQSSAA